MDLSRFSMEGRTVIITGGSGGIGLGCARAFAQAGANLVIVGLPAASLPPAVAQVESLGASAIGVRADVTRQDDVDAMVQQTMDRFDRIDALINVAGGTYSRNPEMPQFTRAPLLELAPEDFMTAYEVNVKTAVLCSRAVVPHMKRQGKGAIVNTGSVSGDLGRKQAGEFSAYGAAKAALHRLTNIMAYQWGPEVRVNCIAPGTIDTPRPAGVVRAELGTAASRIAVGRVGTPDDIASVALFLCSDAASFVNAVVIPVHGGE
ncbi:MAG TPA: SDR family oxidoreductase [Chloroflexota bacterium]|nr:SDR family oxidoreductase [Chloroflexota bacterium]